MLYTHGDAALITITGANGETFTVSGPGAGSEGIELATNPEGLIDEAPIKTIWQQSAFQEGATYLGHTIEPLDLVLKFNLVGDYHDWDDIDSRFHKAFHPQHPATIHYTTHSSGTRTLDVVKLEHATTTSTYDPHILQHSTLVLTLRAPYPFWKADTTTHQLTFTNTSTQTITIENPTDRPIWPQWALSAPGRYELPDYSFVTDPDHPDYPRRARSIITPTLSRGQDLVIDSYPRHETYQVADGSAIAGRFGGVEFLYPIPPHTPPTPVQVKCLDSGGSSNLVELKLENYYTRPFGGTQ
jgi:hypothetical protein